jgi:hypothetical protein
MHLLFQPKIWVIFVLCTLCFSMIFVDNKCAFFWLLNYFYFAADLFYTLCIVRLRNRPRYKRGLRTLGSQRSARSQLRVVDGYHREQRPLDAKRFVPIRISWSRWSIWSCLAFNINFPRQLLYYSISSFALQVVVVSSSLLKR